MTNREAGEMLFNVLEYDCAELIRSAIEKSLSSQGYSDCETWREYKFTFDELRLFADELLMALSYPDSTDDVEIILDIWKKVGIARDQAYAEFNYERKHLHVVR